MASRLAGAAAGLLGWRPEEFWAATPSELAAALAPMLPEVDGLDRDRVEALKQQFPDG